jgi:hypothetical protein
MITAMNRTPKDVEALLSSDFQRPKRIQTFRGITTCDRSNRHTNRCLNLALLI